MLLSLLPQLTGYAPSPFETVPQAAEAAYDALPEAPSSFPDLGVSDAVSAVPEAISEGIGDAAEELGEKAQTIAMIGTVGLVAAALGTAWIVTR